MTINRRTPQSGNCLQSDNADGGRRPLLDGLDELSRTADVAGVVYGNAEALEALGFGLPRCVAGAEDHVVDAVQRAPHAAFRLDLDPVLADREQPRAGENFDVERGDPV